MTINDTNEAKYLLLKELRLHGAMLAESHPWVWEKDRWNELVFALLTQVSNLPENEVRELTYLLDDLGLLDVPSLAKLLQNRKGLNLDDPLSRHIIEIAQEKGFSLDQAQRGVTAICEAALGLKKQFNGKVQNYFRSYGKIMLGDARRIFQFSSLNGTESNKAITYWLQNVLNMPVSLLDTNIQQYCDQNGLKPSQLIAAADELDLNMALLDDLIYYSVAIQNQSNGMKSNEITEGQE